MLPDYLRLFHFSSRRFLPADVTFFSLILYVATVFALFYAPPPLLATPSPHTLIRHIRDVTPRCRTITTLPPRRRFDMLSIFCLLFRLLLPYFSLLSVGAAAASPSITLHHDAATLSPLLPRRFRHFDAIISLR